MCVAPQVDCGGPCSPCATGKTCAIHADCDGAKNECDSGVCVVGCAAATTSACSNCGDFCSGDGNCCSGFGWCGNSNDHCIAVNTDDPSNPINPTACSCMPTCSDGLLNQDETDVSISLPPFLPNLI